MLLVIPHPESKIFLRHLMKRFANHSSCKQYLPKFLLSIKYFLVDLADCVDVNGNPISGEPYAHPDCRKFYQVKHYSVISIIILCINNILMWIENFAIMFMFNLKKQNICQKYFQSLRVDISRKISVFFFEGCIQKPALCVC